MQIRSLAVVALLAAAPATAQTAPRTAIEVAKAFGAREFIRNISLSPDGTKVAMIQPDATRGALLTIADVAAGKPPVAIFKTSGDPEQMIGCEWTTDIRLVCQVRIIDQTGIGPLVYIRVIAINADGSSFKMLTERGSSHALGRSFFGGGVIDLTADGRNGTVLMARDYVPDSTNGTHIASSRDGLGVEEIDTVALSRRNVETPKPNAVRYITDGLGHVRVLGVQGSNIDGYARNIVAYSYRKAGAKDWNPLGTLKINGSNYIGFNPVAVDPGADAVYGFDDLDGRRALFRIALDGSMKREAVVSRPDVDVDDLIQIGRQHRVVGASWVVERRDAIYFDPELKALRASLGRVLPNKPTVSFTDASADEKKLLLFTGSDNDPGRYYLFDKPSRKLEELLPTRPLLSGIPLANVKAISFKAADGTLIPGYLTLPPGSDGRNLPAIVMPHGGPASRDEWGFDWLAQFFAVRGFAVLQPNFRGSSGYGEAWFEKNGFRSWRTAIGDVNDGGRWLQSQGIAAPGKLAIVGWSYGGYAALQSAVLDHDLFKAIVAIAPVTDLDMIRNEARNFSNFQIVDTMIGYGPHIEQGSPARHAAEIKAPVLMFHGDRDGNVGVAESRLMANRLRDAGKPVELVEFKGLDHQLDDSTVRAEMLEKSDAFLRKALGL